MRRLKLRKLKNKNNKNFLVFLIIILCLTISYFISQNKGFKEVLINNSFGFKNNNYYNLLYKNAYGFNVRDTKTFSEIEDPIIYIYNTFQTTKYKSSYNNSYNINSMVTVGSLILADYLKQEGYNSVVENKSVVKVLKDNETPYTKSYRGSKILLEEAKNNYPSLNYFIDLQIASTMDNLLVDELIYAKIKIVVGKEFDSFRENEKLALKLNKLLNESYMGIASIEYREGEGYHGVYNEDFDANLLLIEVGSSNNTITEVNRSLKVLATIYASYLKENI